MNIFCMERPSADAKRQGALRGDRLAAAVRVRADGPRRALDVVGREYVG